MMSYNEHRINIIIQIHVGNVSLSTLTVLYGIIIYIMSKQHIHYTYSSSSSIDNFHRIIFTVEFPAQFINCLEQSVRQFGFVVFLMFPMFRKPKSVVNYYFIRYILYTAVEPWLIRECGHKIKERKEKEKEKKNKKNCYSRHHNTVLRLFPFCWFIPLSSVSIWKRCDILIAIKGDKWKTSLKQVNRMPYNEILYTIWMWKVFLQFFSFVYDAGDDCASTTDSKLSILQLIGNACLVSFRFCFRIIQLSLVVTVCDNSISERQTNTQRHKIKRK